MKAPRTSWGLFFYSGLAGPPAGPLSYVGLIPKGFWPALEPPGCSSKPWPRASIGSRWPAEQAVSALQHEERGKSTARWSTGGRARARRAPRAGEQRSRGAGFPRAGEQRSTGSTRTSSLAVASKLSGSRPSWARGWSRERSSLAERQSYRDASSPTVDRCRHAAQDGQVEYVDHDIVRVWRTPDGASGASGLLVVLYRGDDVEVLERTSSTTKVRLGVGREGWIRGQLRTTVAPPLACAFIDVGQGDACLVTTPSGHRVLVDGGENKLAARYLAARYRDETAAGRDVHFDAIVVTHGDADHFEGLSTLVLDAAADTREGKCIRVTADRVFHNGLVKRKSSLPEHQRLGPPVDIGGVPHAPVLDDPRAAADANRPFKRWQAALDELERRGTVEISHLGHSSSTRFGFLNDLGIEVLGPEVVVREDGAAFLPLLTQTEGGSAVSAARTINGHSVVLRLSYGNVSVLLTGDLHAEMQDRLVDRGLELRSDVLKVPHHGSDDVSRRFVDTVAPLVSVISAGDEDARRDYLHPRANLLAMLGQVRRGAEPVVFVTNLSAFDRWAGEAFYAVREGDTWQPDIARGVFYARERTAFGIIHLRTDGERLLVARKGARKDRHEAYAYVVAADGSATSVAIDSL